MKLVTRSVLLALAALSLGTCARTSAEQDAYQYVIGVSIANLTEPWRINMSEEIRVEAARYPNLRVVFMDAADSSTRQIQDVKKLMDSGIDLLILSPTDAEALTPVIADVYGHIPVILLDRAVIGYGYTLYIGPDNRLIGKQAGQYVTEMLGAKGGKVVEILGRSGSPPTLDRKLGFSEAIAKAGNITIVGSIVADWLRDKAEDELAVWLKKNGKADVIFAQNDAMAFGAWRAATKLGITGMHFVGIDGLPGPARGDRSGEYGSPVGDHHLPDRREGSRHLRDGHPSPRDGHPEADASANEPAHRAGHCGGGLERSSATPPRSRPQDRAGLCSGGQ